MKPRVVQQLFECSQQDIAQDKVKTCMCHPLPPTNGIPVEEMAQTPCSLLRHKALVQQNLPQMVTLLVRTRDLVKHACHRHPCQTRGLPFHAQNTMWTTCRLVGCSSAPYHFDSLQTFPRNKSFSRNTPPVGVLKFKKAPYFPQVHNLDRHKPQSA